MATQTLLNAASYAAIAAGASTLLGVSPFLDGQNCRARISLSPDAAGAGVVKLQGSPDGTTWTDLITVTGIGLPVTEQEVVCAKYMRGNVTTAGTAGKVSVFLEGLT